MKDHNYSETDIQNYILGELSEEEVLKLKKAMKENPELALEVNNHRKIAEGIEYYGSQNFKKRVKDIYSEVRPEVLSKTKSGKSNASFFKLGLAAFAAIFLLFILYKYTAVSTNLTPQEIYAQNYKTYNWNPSLRSDDTTTKLDRAVDLYTSNSFSEAIPLISEYIIEKPNDIRARLALANAYLENGNSELAVPHLEYVLSMDDVLYQDQARWYLAFVYLKSDQIEKAKTQFVSLAKDESSDYYRDSKLILDQLNN